jgi:ketosteroid isomerase-like protein
MTVELPNPIADYFEADRHKDAEAIARCFAKDAVVKDEGHTYSGHGAIQQWKAHTSTKYSYTSDRIAITIEQGRTIVTSHLVGDFPGSPLNLRYYFVLKGGRIAELEIAQ